MAMPRAWQGQKQVQGQRDGEAQRDKLQEFFAQTAFARSVLERLQEDGYAVLPGVFSKAEADRELERMWDFVETVSPTVKRHSSRTWWSQGRGDPDPWPCAQRDMMQLHQAGWVFSDLREQFAQRVFEKIYSTRELHCSKDGFTFQRPTWSNVARSPNDHFDQGLDMLGLHCVQGSVALTDQEERDGCFLCWPGSHRFREEILTARSYKQARRDFIILTDAEKEVLRGHGISPRRVPVKKGDVVLFRSDLCHCGAPPLGARDNFRAVVYVCCLPAALTPDEVYAEKMRAFERLETGAHWPTREEWFEMREAHRRLAIRPYFKTPPRLTQRQQELYGLVRYSEEPQEPAAAVVEEKVAEDKLVTKRRWQNSRSQTGQRSSEHTSMPSRGSGESAGSGDLCAEERPSTAPSHSIVADSEAAPPNSTPEYKEARKLSKAVREIEQLESRRQEGEKLQLNQLKKIEKKAEFLQRLQRLPRPQAPVIP